MLPISRGCLEPLIFHTTTCPSLTSSATYCLVWTFSPRVSVGGVYRSPLLYILPALWIFYFHVVFFPEIFGTFVKSLHISSWKFILYFPNSLNSLSFFYFSWSHSELSVSHLSRGSPCTSWSPFTCRLDQVRGYFMSLLSMADMRPKGEYFVLASMDF